MARRELDCIFITFMIHSRYDAFRFFGTSNKYAHGVDLFAGAGGMSLGLKMAGFSVVGAVENDLDACATHETNFPGVDLWAGDIRHVDWGRWRGVDVIAGGPPCQPFSVAGPQMGSNDIRDMVPEFIRAVREVRPRAFVMENVAGLLTARFKTYFDHCLRQFEGLGYFVSWRILEASDYGVPQRRCRVVIVGTATNGFRFPEPTHGVNGVAHVSVRQALANVDPGDLNPAIVTYAKTPILRKSPYAGMLCNGQGRPLNLDAPSLTIPATAGGNRTHILDPEGVLKTYHDQLMNGGPVRAGLVRGVRRLTLNESSALQGFPSSYQFSGRKSKRFRQIGNAVPPQLAAAVFATLRAQIHNEVVSCSSRESGELARTS